MESYEYFGIFRGGIIDDAYDRYFLNEWEYKFLKKIAEIEVFLPEDDGYYDQDAEDDNKILFRLSEKQKQCLKKINKKIVFCYKTNKGSNIEKYMIPFQFAILYKILEP